MRAVNPTPNSPTTNPQDRPESTPRSLWKQDDEGRWYNSDVCTEEDDEAEIGNAEPSEEEETKE